jgi:hypothetical protein
MNILPVILFCGILSGSQVIAHKGDHENRRVQYQTYVEASALAFWTRWPDPFSQSIIRNDYPLAQAISYFNALAGKLTVGMLDMSNDSIVHRFNPRRHMDSVGSFWPHAAEPIASRLSGVRESYRTPDTTTFSFVLMVNEKRKTILDLSFDTCCSIAANGMIN